jgi:hypothetical protein
MNTNDEGHDPDAAADAQMTELDSVVSNFGKRWSGELTRDAIVKVLLLGAAAAMAVQEAVKSEYMSDADKFFDAAKSRGRLRPRKQRS